MQPAILVENAHVYLSGREVLHGIDWEVQRGERCFILGANGAGKTTLVRMLMGYAWPLFGATVQVLGHRFGSELARTAQAYRLGESAHAQMAWRS